MPGIIGCFDRSGNSVPKKLATEMIGSMKHEDWYVEEWILDPYLMGIVELDFVKSGKNLICCDFESLTGVSRGTIYNKKELSRKFGISYPQHNSDDTRFLVEMYQKEDLDFAKYLNGLFVVAIYDKKKDRIVIANDRYGYYPLFYSLTHKNFIFASEAKAVLKDHTITPKINRDAIPEFFAFSFLLGDKTFFHNVQKMPPATISIYDRGKDQFSSNQYWDFSRKKNESQKPLRLHLKEFNKLMKKAVKCRVKDKEVIGVFLSGGLDSRIIAAFASQTKTPLVSFTFGVKGCSEQKIASEVSERLGIENRFYEIPSDFIANYAEQIVYKGDGLVRIRDCHFIALLDKVRKKVHTILLGTFGGDLAGLRLPPTRKLKSLRTKDQVVNYLLEFYTSTVAGVLPIGKHQRAFTDTFFKETKGIIRKNFIRTFNEIRFTSPIDIADYWEYRNREPRYIFQASQHINWYLETRHPFMDNEVVDFLAFRLPPHLRRKTMFGIVVENTFLQRAISLDFPSLSNLPWHGFQPNAGMLTIILELARAKVSAKLEKLLRKKIRFSPIDFRGYEDWLRTGSKAYTMNLLLDAVTQGRPYFSQAFVKKMIGDHMNYKENHDQLLCDLMNFELMNRIFLEKKSH